MEFVKITSVKQLSERHLVSIEKLGFDVAALGILSKAVENWFSQSERLTAARFRSRNRKAAGQLEWLVNKQFLRSEHGNYVPQFSAFSILLVAKKRIASRLLRPMELALKTARRLLRENPDRNYIPLSEFSKDLSSDFQAVEALRLLGTAGLQFTVNNEINPTVHFDDSIFRDKTFLTFVSRHVEMICRQSQLHSSIAVNQAPDFPVNTFTLRNLALVSDALRQATSALNNISNHPEAAISEAKSALEAALKWIAQREDVEFQNGVSLPKLLNLCKPVLALGSNPSHTLARAIASMCNAIAEARNLLGNSHGKSPNAVAPTRSEARLIVGVTLQLTECLLERWEATHQTRLMPQSG
jgi:Abortive infection C-terminus